MCSGTQYLKLKMMDTPSHYVRTASMGGIMSDAIYNLIFVLDSFVTIILKIGLISVVYHYLRK